MAMFIIYFRNYNTFLYIFNSNINKEMMDHTKKQYVILF